MQLSLDVYVQEIVATSGRPEGVSVEVLVRPIGSSLPTSVYYDLLSQSKAKKIILASMTSILNLDFSDMSMIAGSGEQICQLFFNVEPELLPEIKKEIVEFHAMLKMYGIKLVIELTERVTLEFDKKYRDISETLFELSDEGICFAMDDFSGFRDVRRGWLLTGAISIVKLVLPNDFSYVSKSRHDFLFLVNEIKARNVDVVIEKVETFKELLCLDMLSCDYVQGHFFGEPQKVSALSVF
ncbi:EAL domain-containing protein [Shewanella waksmanii]|uniref:EAL domain-containing protein n=1 Tax=Shewanella waksmanii TaxID=213783 RepID=UPI00049152AD|nr:EAL domain-containing protein [Shewanella waksmanii]